MKTAVVYFSQGGNTAFAAREIARLTGADLIRIEPEVPYPAKGFRKFFYGGKSVLAKELPRLAPYEFDDEKYDLVIFGSPVWASRPAPPLVSFIKDNREALSDKRIASFVCCAGGEGGRALARLRSALDISAFTQSLVLVDPKDKPSQEKLSQMRDFAAALAD